MADKNAGPFVMLKLTKRVRGEVEDEQLIRIPLYVAWDIMEVVHTVGVELALRFASFAITVARLSPTEEPAPTQEEMAKLGGALSFLAEMLEPRPDGPRSDKLEERLLAFTYQFLRHTTMDRKMAAEFAAVKLKKGQVDDAWHEAWRKRVNRWAKSRNLPPIGKARKPRKVTTLY
jgi:hypothetical protein